MSALFSLTHQWGCGHSRCKWFLVGSAYRTRSRRWSSCPCPWSPGCFLLWYTPDTCQSSPWPAGDALWNIQHVWYSMFSMLWLYLLNNHKGFIFIYVRFFFFKLEHLHFFTCYITLYKKWITCNLQSLYTCIYRQVYITVIVLKACSFEMLGFNNLPKPQ